MKPLSIENESHFCSPDIEGEIMAETRMISLKNLNGKRFVIPTYQRGFRWTPKQIDELLNDLCDFYKNNDRKIFCLQLIVVRKLQEGVYEVIDGQQRLTVLWLLIQLRNSILPPDRKFECDYALDFDGKKDFNLTFKNIQVILQTLSHQVKMERLNDAFVDYCSPSKSLRSFEVRIEQFNMSAMPFSNIDLQPSADIDSAYLLSAIIHVLGEYKYYDKDFYKIADDYLFRSEFDSHEKDIQFIEYEMNPSGSEEEQSAKVISKFSNINANKIPLTESELIKAYFIKAFRSDEAKRKGFALKWEEIERKLSDNRFWKFFTNSSDDDLYETRMDFLFEVLLEALMANEKDKSDKAKTNEDAHYLSTQFDLRIKESLSSASSLWNDIIAVYDTLCDWYNDYEFYHIIGLIVEAETQKSSCQIIIDLYKKYTDSETRTKTAFIRTLKEIIRKLEAYKDMSLDGEDISVSGVDNSISYGGRCSQSIKPVILLYNIALLVNAYKSKDVETKEYADSFERFPFDYYKNTNKKTRIEIEHINPRDLANQQHDTEDTDVINAVKHLNHITNLTLLDKSLNASYGASSFTEKSKHILAARYGLKYNRTEHKSSIIFPGTSWVFLRQYTDEPSVSNLWTSKDRDAYEASMKDSIKRFFEID